MYPKKWEYTVQDCPKTAQQDLNEWFNWWGSHGWELVAVLTLQTGFTYLFKRPATED